MIKTFDPKVWFQTSHKYRYIARLPPGKNGIQALMDASINEYNHVLRQIESSCKMMYLRCWAEKEGFCEHLTIEEFEKFKKDGGTAA